MKLRIEHWLRFHKIHIWVWSCFIIYETIVVGILYNIWGNPITYLLHYAVTVSLFYLHSNYAIPWAIKKKSLAIFRVILIASTQVILYILLHFLTDLLLIAIKIIVVNEPYSLNSTFIVRNLYRGFFFMGFATGYYFLSNYIKERRHAEDLEKERLNIIIKQENTEKELFKAQNAFLKAQINPHFLFNTLNFIYNKVSKSSPEAAEAVISLSEMMRYAITSDDKGGTIILQDEMEQVKNLVNLFKLRRNQPLYLSVEFEERAKYIQFIPLVLLTLTENIFKHGQLDDANHEATLQVYIDDETLFFETHNLSQPQKSNRAHTGLANIKDRLTYAYGNEVIFEYATRSDGYFTLKIGVPLAFVNKPV